MYGGRLCAFIERACTEHAALRRADQVVEGHVAKVGVGRVHLVQQGHDALRGPVRHGGMAGQRQQQARDGGGQGGLG